MGLHLNPQWVRFAAFVVLLVAAIAVLFLLAPLIWSMVQVFVIAALLALALDSVIHWQVTRGVPRWAATGDLILALLIATTLGVYFLMPRWWRSSGRS